jgi:hypothetical protein
MSALTLALRRAAEALRAASRLMVAVGAERESYSDSPSLAITAAWQVGCPGP